MCALIKKKDIQPIVFETIIKDIQMLNQLTDDTIKYMSNKKVKFSNKQVQFEYKNRLKVLI